MKLNPTVQDFLDYRAYNPCTEQHHRHAVGPMLYTDGVKLLAEAAQCYWLLDLIGSYQPSLAKEEDFQSWVLDFNIMTSKWEASCSDGDKRELVRQVIDYSDFPRELAPQRLWLTNGVLLLPEEY